MDKIIKISIVIAIAIVALAILINDIGITDPFSGYMEGQTVTGHDRSEAINIASGDPYIHDILVTTMVRLHFNNTVKDVQIAKFHSTGPGISSFINYYELLPAVEYVLGNESQSGVDMYAFVDINNSRVAYIGYAPRWGFDDGQFTYEIASGGVVVKEEYNDTEIPCYAFSNTSIMDTGFNPGHNFTDDETREIVSIAINDSKVKEFLGGQEYLIKDMGVGSSSSDGYIYAYPDVSIQLKNGTVWDSMYVTVDVRNKKVIEAYPNRPLPTFN
jgi:hypothetical protein